MDLYKSISERRSHRQFTDEKISRKELEEILEAGLLAPSPKNRQPWYFVSCGLKKKNRILSILKRKIEEFSAESKNVGSLPISAKAIAESTHFLLVYNQYSNKEPDYNQNRWKADILSIGACIQNILLTAHSKNIQTLWIGDILSAEIEINNLMGIEDELIAGVVFGIGKRKEIPQRPRIELKNKFIQTD
jgi:nitroreductase